MCIDKSFPRDRESGMVGCIKGCVGGNAGWLEVEKQLASGQTHAKGVPAGAKDDQAS
jgi:hypothetical protein